MGDGARIVISGDNSDFDSKAEKSAEKVKKVAHNASLIGKEIHHTGREFERMALKVGSVIALLDAAAKATENLRNETKEVSKAAGAGALSRDRSLARLGLGKEFAAVIDTGVGGTSIEQRNSFLEALSGIEGVDKTTAARAITAFNSGAFDQDELLKKVKNGESIDPGDTQRRLATLGPEATQELAARSAERESEARRAAKLSASGSRARVVDAETQAALGDNRAAAFAGELGKSIPVAGGVIGAIIDKGREGAAERHLERIANNTQPKPARNAGKEGSP